MAAAGQFMHKVRSDETGGSCDEAVHTVHNPVTPSFFNPIFGQASKSQGNRKRISKIKIDAIKTSAVRFSSFKVLSLMAIPKNRMDATLDLETTVGNNPYVVCPRNAVSEIRSGPAKKSETWT
jgi:hypothetical protein